MKKSNSFSQQTSFNKETLAMLDLNLPKNDDVGTHLQRGRYERAASAANLLHAGAEALRNGIAALKASHARRQLRRETVRQLSTLPDRALQDIGIPRSQIWAIADDLVNGGVPYRGPESVHRQRKAANRNRVDSSAQLITPAAATCG